jgi:hypothetical protein
MLISCAPAISVGTSTTSDLRPAAYHTYSWATSDQFPTGDPRLDNNALFIAQVQRAADEQLQALGMRRVDTRADLLVHFHATMRDRVDVYEVDRNAGYDQRGYGAGTQVLQYEEGTILIDVAETDGKRLIWRGWMQTDLGGAIGNDEALGKRVHSGIAKMFAQFPASCIMR